MKLEKNISQYRYGSSKTIAIKNNRYDPDRQNNFVLKENFQLEVNGRAHFLDNVGTEYHYRFEDFGGKTSYKDLTKQSTTYSFFGVYVKSDQDGDPYFWGNAPYEGMQLNAFDKIIEDSGGEDDCIELLHFYGTSLSQIRVSINGNDLILSIGNERRWVIKDQLANNGHQIEWLRLSHWPDMNSQNTQYNLLDLAKLAQSINNKQFGGGEADLEHKLEDLIGKLATMSPVGHSSSVEASNIPSSPQSQIAASLL